MPAHLCVPAPPGQRLRFGSDPTWQPGESWFGTGETRSGELDSGKAAAPYKWEKIKSRRFFFPKETFMSHVYFENTYLFSKYRKKANHLASHKRVKLPRILVTQAGKCTSGIFLTEVLTSVFVYVCGSFSHPPLLIQRVESKFAHFWVACVHSGLLPAESGHCGHLHGARPPGGGGQVRTQRLLHRLRRYLSIRTCGFWLHVVWPTPPPPSPPRPKSWVPGVGRVGRWVREEGPGGWRW